MSELTYEDFKQRISIQELLLDAGYRLNRRDGLRYPSYVRLDSENRRIRGDKYIVTGNGMCCFRPPERKNYNVISFIKEHPELFNEYTPGMSKDRLVNLVCHRLLNQPVEDKESKIASSIAVETTFDIDRYELTHFDQHDWNSQKRFYGYFRNRGIALDTQRAFAEHILLASITRENGKRYTHLAFPMRIPGKEEIVGFEERSRPDINGKSAYKGKAAGSNSSEGLWIANLSGLPIAVAKDIYWFESGYDAMSYYQLYSDKHRLDKAIFLSTGGTPGERQFEGMLALTPEANHHLCFDRDRAGLMYAINFALQRDGRKFSNYLTPQGEIIVRDMTDRYGSISIPTDGYDFKGICESIGITDTRTIHHLPHEGYKDWNEQLLGNKTLKTDRVHAETHKGTDMNTDTEYEKRKKVENKIDMALSEPMREEEKDEGSTKHYRR